MGKDLRYLVIPAAGLGTRMTLIDSDTPKEMLPIGAKPAIQYAVEEGLHAGIKNIIIIISRKKEIIRKYFEEGTYARGLFPDASEDVERIRKDCSVSFLYQQDPLGESDAIYLAKELVEGNPMAILYPDTIYFPAPGALKRLSEVFWEYKKDVVALVEVTTENSSGVGNAGRVDIAQMANDLFEIVTFYPKGTGHFVPRFEGELRTCGISVNGPDIFRFIDKARLLMKNNTEFTDGPVRNLILREKGLLGCRLRGMFFDIGSPVGYELCLNYVQRMKKRLTG